MNEYSFLRYFGIKIRLKRIIPNRMIEIEYSMQIARAEDKSQMKNEMKVLNLHSIEIYRPIEKRNYILCSSENESGKNWIKR